MSKAPFAGLVERLAALSALAHRPEAFAQARRALLEEYFREVEEGKRAQLKALQRQIDMEAAVTPNPIRRVGQLLGHIDDRIAALENIVERRLEKIDRSQV